MARKTRHRALSLALGVVTGAGLWWIGTDPVLTAAAVIAVVVLGLIGGRLVRDHPEYTDAAGSWRENKRRAAGQVFAVVVSFQAVYAVSVSFANRIGLFVVVFATYMVGYFLGGFDALERDANGDPGDQTDAVAPADD